jgi:hypothetical protein
MAYQETLISCPPEDPIPEQRHTEEFYDHVELVKKKGRR